MGLRSLEVRRQPEIQSGPPIGGPLSFWCHAGRRAPGDPSAVCRRGPGETISRANLDGSGKKLNFVANAEAPCSTAIDSGHLYWAGLGGSAHIGRASILGSSPEPERVSLGATTVPCGLAVNSANVLFADTGFFGHPLHEIGRANISGTAL